jgi:hypothetical protein
MAVASTSPQNRSGFFLGDREFADPIVAERTLEFLIVNKTKILTCFPTLVPQV